MSTPMLTIREAGVEDIPLILAFLRKKADFDGALPSLRATADALRQTVFADPPLAHVVFAELEGSPVAFASYFFTFSTFLVRPGLWLDDLYVDADMRSQGVGAAILRFLARLAKTRNCGRIEWTAAVGNERGLEFYRRNGAVIREATRLCRLDSAAIDRLVLNASEGSGKTPRSSHL